MTQQPKPHWTCSRFRCLVKTSRVKPMARGNFRSTPRRIDSMRFLDPRETIPCMLKVGARGEKREVELASGESSICPPKIHHNISRNFRGKKSHGERKGPPSWWFKMEQGLFDEFLTLFPASLYSYPYEYFIIGVICLVGIPVRVQLLLQDSCRMSYDHKNC